MNIYAVHDIKAEAYLQPFFAQTDGLAIRMFQAAANDQEHQFWKYAEDYTLFNIGVWDEKNGVLHSSTKEPLGTAIQYREGTVVEALTKQTDKFREIAEDEIAAAARDIRDKYQNDLDADNVGMTNSSEPPQKNPESS